jgi:hypothetical protein
MLGDHANRHTKPREFGERALKAGRMLHMCHENGTEDPWDVQGPPEEVRKQIDLENAKQAKGNGGK